ncbi:MAG: hypothetical protein KAY13_09285 [Zoogloea sp.]|nr:hypothetical protein [Zoogloea sp.]
MHTLIFTCLGLLALAIICWQAWRERVTKKQRIPPDWEASLVRMSNEQMHGRHREVRESVLQACQRLECYPARSRVAPHVRVRLAVLLARDPVYTEVVRAIRTACAAEPAVSEMALCVGMRQYLLEDIRQCMAIAEHFGQIRRQAQAGDSLVIASFHPTT